MEISDENIKPRSNLETHGRPKGQGRGAGQATVWRGPGRAERAGTFLRRHSAPVEYERLGQRGGAVCKACDCRVCLKFLKGSKLPLFNSAASTTTTALQTHWYCSQRACPPLRLLPTRSIPSEYDNCLLFCAAANLRCYSSRVPLPTLTLASLHTIL